MNEWMIKWMIISYVCNLAKCLVQGCVRMAVHKWLLTHFSKCPCWRAPGQQLGTKSCWLGAKMASQHRFGVKCPLILKYFLQSSIFHKTFPNNFQFLSLLCQTLSNMSVSAFVLGQHDSLFTHKSHKSVLIFRERLYCLSLHFSATENLCLISVYGMMCWLSHYLLFDCVSYTYWGSFISGLSIWFWKSLWMVVIHASHCGSP